MKKDTFTTCQCCHSSFQCQADDITNCQCTSITISKETQQYLSTANYGCLCKNCLLEINQKVEKGKNYYIKNR